jgi:hypothetical protein
MQQRLTKHNCFFCLAKRYRTTMSATKVLASLSERSASKDMMPLENALRILESGLREALIAAGIREHRALVTGTAEDAEAYAKSLEAVNDAYARLWAYEAHGSKVRVADVEAARGACQAEIDVLGASSAAQLAVGKAAPDLDLTRGSMLDAHLRMLATQPLPESAVRVTAPPPLSSARTATTSTGRTSSRKVPGDPDAQRRIRRRLRKAAS